MNTWSRIAAPVAVAVTIAVTGPAAADVLRFSHTDNPGVSRQAAAELFAEKVAEYTDGRHTVRIYPSGQLANDPKAVEQLQLGGLDFTVTATGTVEPINTVEISSELSGTVRAVNADYNDEVKTGDVLATLDTDKLEANVEHATASVTAAKANLVEAEVTLEEKKNAYDRAVQLSEQGISSQETLLANKAGYERAVATLDTAKANVKVAEADLRLARTDLDKACICSPIDGIVLDRAVEVGQIVAASLSAPVLFTLAEDLTHMNLTVDIDEDDPAANLVGKELASEMGWPEGL